MEAAETSGINVDFEPQYGRGKFHDAQAARISVLLRSPIVVHGFATLEGVRHNATLLVFSVNTGRMHMKEILETLFMEVEFTELSDSPKEENNPTVVNHAPNGVHLLWDKFRGDWTDNKKSKLGPSIETQVASGSGGTNVKQAYEPSDVDASQDVSKHIHYATWAHSYSYGASDGSGGLPKTKNALRFHILSERYGEGIPRTVRFAVLLKRANDRGIRCVIRMNVWVQGPRETKEFTNGNRTVKEFNITEHATEGVEFDSNHLEIYSDLWGPTKLRDLVSVKLPLSTSELPTLRRPDPSPVISSTVMPPEPEPVALPMPGAKEEPQTVREKQEIPRQQHPRPIPPGFIQRLDDGRFCVKTRNRCNDVFVDIIQANSEGEAETFFRAVDRYDMRRGPICKFRSRLWDLYWTFAPPTQPGRTKIASLEEGLQLEKLDATVKAPVPSTDNPEFVGGSPAAANQEAEGHARHNLEDTEHDPAAEALVTEGDTSTPAADPPKDGAGPHHGGNQSTYNSSCSAFICVTLGRQSSWKLRYVKFTKKLDETPRAEDEPPEAKDKDIFNQARFRIGEYQKKRWLLRFLFPLRVSKVEYYEFTLYNKYYDSVSLEKGQAVQGKLPSDHEPFSEWRTRCPQEKWYFTAPKENETETVRSGLATATLTDAVRHPYEFSRNPNSDRYRRYVPWRLKNKLDTDPKDFPLGWGFVVRFEFDFFVFWCIWGTMSLLLSLGLLFGLYIAASGPAHGQTGVAVAIFLAPSGFLGTVFGGAYAFAKQRKYLD